MTEPSPKSCKFCSGFGLWPSGEMRPVAAKDAETGQTGLICPECQSGTIDPADIEKLRLLEKYGDHIRANMESPSPKPTRKGGGQGRAGVSRLGFL